MIKRSERSAPRRRAVPNGGASRLQDAPVRAGRWSTETVRAREQAREEERRRLGRELHDDLGQALLGLKLNLVWVQHRVAKPTPASLADVGEKLPALVALVERSIQTVTAIVTDLRPPALEQLGLVAALEWQTESFARRTGSRCRFAGMADLDELDMGRATAVFRMFQEMLTNIERHAQANRVTVEVRRATNRLVLRVHDNGRGVAATQALAPSSFGLLGMRERAQLLGGTLKIESAPGRGTTLTAAIPLANRRSGLRVAQSPSDD
jgi:two-component system sensor histidine kinase UhpB